MNFRMERDPRHGNLGFYFSSSKKREVYEGASGMEEKYGFQRGLGDRIVKTWGNELG